jgi:hypothetical protein
MVYQKLLKFLECEQIELKENTICDWMNEVARETNKPWTKIAEDTDTITYVGKKRGQK